MTSPRMDQEEPKPDDDGHHSDLAAASSADTGGVPLEATEPALRENEDSQAGGWETSGERVSAAGGTDETIPDRDFSQPIGHRLFAAEHPADVRVYVPDSIGWEARIKSDSEKIYCYSRNPDEQYFHLIVNGEIYLQQAHEKYCLRCALRLGVLTLDRLFWQRRPGQRRPVI